MENPTHGVNIFPSADNVHQSDVMKLNYQFLPNTFTDNAVLAIVSNGRPKSQYINRVYSQQQFQYHDQQRTHQYLDPHTAEGAINTVPFNEKPTMQNSSHMLPEKSKRHRTSFTSYQLSELESEFRNHMFLYRTRRINIAQRLKLCERQVKIWFQNRRIKQRKLMRSSYEKLYKYNDEMNESDPHKMIVKRLMSYSQDPAVKFYNSMEAKISMATTDEWNGGN